MRPGQWHIARHAQIIVKGDDSMALKNAYLIDLMDRVEARNPNDKQFLITVRSVLESI